MKSKNYNYIFLFYDICGGIGEMINEKNEV